MLRGIASFYYSRNLPANSVAIAKISCAASTPAQLTDINNIPSVVSGVAPGLYQATGFTSGVVYSAGLLNKSVTISGDTTYKLQNQFFELTNVFDTSSNPLYYSHLLPPDANAVSVINLDSTVFTGFTIQGNTIYHSCDGSVKFVRYYSDKSLHTDLLQYGSVLQVSYVTVPPTGTYGYSQGILTLPASSNYSIRWTRQNGYQVLPLYNVLANDPWYPRIRFGANPADPEWARQLFIPFRPYQLATWVPGKLVAPQVIEFERPNIYWDGKQYPDVLIFDQDYNLKFAIDGSPANTPPRRGYLYPWKRSQFAPNGFDPVKARVNVVPPIESTDLIFGFYYYAEQDLLYQDLDVNPFSNPYMKNKLVEFFYKQDGSNPFRNVYHRLYNSDGSLDTTPAGTNDPNPTSGSGTTFAHMVVGDSVGVNQYTLTDARVQGGGLLPDYQSIPEAQNFWDIGYLDGKPYPLGGTMAIYLPISLLQPVGSWTKEEIESKVNSLVTMGTLPIIRYYDQNGEESV